MEITACRLCVKSTHLTPRWAPFSGLLSPALPAAARHIPQHSQHTCRKLVSVTCSSGRQTTRGLHQRYDAGEGAKMWNETTMAIETLAVCCSISHYNRSRGVCFDWVFTHSVTHSLTQPSTHPHTLTHPPIHSLTYSLSTIHPPTQSLIHSHPTTHPLTHSLTHPLNLTHPPTHSFTHPPTQSLAYAPTH